MKLVKKLFAVVVGALLCFSARAESPIPQMPPTLHQAYYTIDYYWDYEGFEYVNVNPYLAQFNWWYNDPANDFMYFLEISTDGGRSWCTPGASCDGFGGSPMISWNWSIFPVYPGVQSRFFAVPR